MATTNRIGWETLRSRAGSSFNNTYQTLGVPLVYPSYILKMVNNTTIDVTVSIDGTTDIDVCPAGSFWLYDESRYIPNVLPMPALPKGTQIYVKGSAAGTGTIYLVSQYLVNI